MPISPPVNKLSNLKNPAFGNFFLHMFLILAFSADERDDQLSLLQNAETNINNIKDLASAQEEWARSASPENEMDEEVFRRYNPWLRKEFDIQYDEPELDTGMATKDRLYEMINQMYGGKSDAKRFSDISDALNGPEMYQYNGNGDEPQFSQSYDYDLDPTSEIENTKRSSHRGKWGRFLRYGKRSILPNRLTIAELLNLLPKTSVFPEEKNGEMTSKQKRSPGNLSVGLSSRLLSQILTSKRRERQEVNSRNILSFAG